MKAILSKPYFVIPLALAGLLVNGALLIGGLSFLGRVFSPEAPAEVAESEQTPSQPAADVEPAPAPDPSMVTLQDALPVGYEAAVMAQTAKTEQEWNAVAKQWLAAIKILEKVPSTSPDYPAAKAKSNEYLKNVDIAGAKANAASRGNAQSLTAPTTKTKREPEELLAVIDGQPKQVAEYAILLDQLMPKCQENRMLLADMSVKTQELLTQKGASANNLQILNAAYQSVEPYSEPQKCAEAFALIATIVNQ
jgi:hypothetical protein